MSFCPTLYDKIDLQIAEAKGVVIPKTSLSIMEDNKWDQGMIDDRNTNPQDTNTVASVNENENTGTNQATETQQSQTDEKTTC